MTKSSHENPDGQSSESPDDELVGRLACEYMDRLVDGDSIDVDEILKQHSRLGPQVVRELETFTGLSPDRDEDDNPSLGTLGDYALRRQIGRGGMGRDGYRIQRLAELHGQASRVEGVASSFGRGHQDRHTVRQGSPARR